MVRSSDFKFWEEKLPEDSTSLGDSMEFQIERHVEDQFTVYTPSWWKRAQLGEASPLLSRDPRDNSCCSPTSRRRAIMDGRKELMEMINDMPESSFELSLRDIVDDLQTKGEIKEKQVVQAEEKKVEPKRERRVRPKNQNTKSRGNQISRTESMESEVFMLKMFLPLSLSSKKKSTAATRRSNICPGDEPEKRANRDWWKMIFLSTKDNRKATNISRSRSDISNNRTSMVESTSLPCQRSLSEKCKSRGQRGCLF